MNLNPKLRSDSVFAQLTNEQIEQLEDWLFEEKLSYKETIEKIENTFGVKTSQTALGRYFRRLAEGRAQEWRIETIAQCLEALATAKGDGTLQAGLFTMANMHAVRLMTEEKPSFREITGWLRAMTSAGNFEMGRVEIYEAKEKARLAEIKRREEEAKEMEARARWSVEYHAKCEAREAKRKATLAAKKAAAVAAEGQMSNGKGQMSREEMTAKATQPIAATLLELEQRATSPRPNDFPSPPPVSFPKVDERFALSGPPEAERGMDGASRATEGSAVVVAADPSKGGTLDGLLGSEGLVEGKDFTINWAGNPEKPLKTR